MKKSSQGLTIKMFLFFILAVVVVGLMLFLPAGTLAYWQAWVFMAVLFIPVTFVVSYLLKQDPGLLERRMRFKEKESKQKAIIKLADLFFFLGFLIPGLDYRYGWSQIPLFAVILADIIIFLGYVLVFFVFKENSYASRIVEVNKMQKVISTGPYSLIRHPMYAGMISMFVAIPFALGSYWAFPFFIPVIALIVFRILNEEEILLKGLAGYRKYCQKVRYRLIPGIW